MEKLALPEQVVRSWRTFQWPIATIFFIFHVLAIGMLIPPFRQYLFSPSAVIVALGGVFLFAVLGINICYHRLLTHRSFKTYRWLERCLTLLAFCDLEGSSRKWVGTHREHHQWTDEQPDPHSPRAGAIWAHIGWILWGNPAIDNRELLDQKIKDLLKDPFHRWFDEKNRWFLVALAHMAIIFGLGALYGWLRYGEWLQYGLSWLFWGVIMRTVVMWHFTWTVNSLSHMVGYRNYNTKDTSRNVWWLILFTFSESLHNNHHKHPRSASNWHKWWEIDLAYCVIWALEKVGLVWDVILPDLDRINAKAA